MAWHQHTGRGDQGSGFYFESVSDPDNVMMLFANSGGGLTVAIAEEKPVDSYNETFECTISLPADEAKRLRDYLIEHFPT